MRSRPITSILLLLVLWTSLGSAFGQSQGLAKDKLKPSQGSEADANSVGAWLSRIDDAAGRYDFHGTLVVSAGGGVHSARIVHVCSGGERYERIDALDGQPRQIFRQRRVVHTFWPRLQAVQIEQRDELPNFPALVQGGAYRIAAFYDLKKLGVDRVAGLDADVLLLAPRDDARFAHRLWAESKTGLLLRAEVLGERNEVLESSAFTELVLGSRLSGEALIKSMPKLDGLRVIRKLVKPFKLSDEGWTLGALVPGFQQVSSVKRRMHRAEHKDDRDRDTLQMVFSDGMTYVSMFIEPLDAARDQSTLQASIGATHTLMRRQGDWWITVMGDVPSITLERFYAALERKR